jgi:hypothetical protein
MNTKYILITVIVVVAGTIFSLMDGFIYLEKLIGIIDFLNLLLIQQKAFVLFNLRIFILYFINEHIEHLPTLGVLNEL